MMFMTFRLPARLNRLRPHACSFATRGRKHKLRAPPVEPEPTPHVAALAQLLARSAERSAAPTRVASLIGVHIASIEQATHFKSSLTSVRVQDNELDLVLVSWSAENGVLGALVRESMAPESGESNMLVLDATPRKMSAFEHHDRLVTVIKDAAGVAMSRHILTRPMSWWMLLSGLGIWHPRRAALYSSAIAKVDVAQPELGALTCGQHCMTYGGSFPSSAAEVCPMSRCPKSDLAPSLACAVS